MRSLPILYLFFLATVTFESCGESSPVYRDSHGQIYLNRITNLNHLDENDCSLGRCDERRIDRWQFEEVHGQVINDSTIYIHTGIDGLFVLMICQNKLSQYSPYEEVIITGIGRDGCGYYVQNFCCDTGLFLDIFKIRRY